MSDAVFANMADNIIGHHRFQVTHEEFTEFNRQWIFDALRGMRYGESFCTYFAIGNASPLFHFKDKKISERWIRDNYLIS
jgi:hypothetical protein